ncbi:MAG: hypothetical protein JNK65_08150, partial [Deltaproteobacteria bacterium]|nr:hypothetical protein [Deltaproteobacteria bacterium]
MSCHFQFRLFQNPSFALECNPPGTSQPLAPLQLNAVQMLANPLLPTLTALGSSVAPPRFPQVRLIPRSMGLSLFNPTGPNLLPRNPVSISVPDLLRSENLPFSAVDASPRPGDPVSPQVASLSANESFWVSPLVHILGNLLSSANIVLSGVPVNAAADGLTEEPQAGSPEASAPRASREDMRCRYTEFSPIHHFTNITPNGELQEHSCADAEYSRRPECDPGPRQVCFSPNTTATVTIQIRPVVGSDESI